MASEEDYRKAEWKMVDGFQRHDYSPTSRQSIYTEFTDLINKGNFTQDQLNQLLHSSIGDGSPDHPSKYFYYLVEHAGADVNAKVGGETALHTAARMGSESHCYYLLGHGANPNLTDDKGHKPHDVIPGSMARSHDSRQPSFDPTKMQWDSKPNHSRLEFNALEINAFLHDTSFLHDSSRDFLGDEYRKHLHENNEKKARLLEYAEQHPQAFQKLKKAPRPVVLEDWPEPSFSSRSKRSSRPHDAAADKADAINIFAPLAAGAGMLGLGMLSGGGIGIGTVIAAIVATLAAAVGTQYFTKTGAFAPRAGDTASLPARVTEKAPDAPSRAPEKPAAGIDDAMQRALALHKSGYQPAAPADDPSQVVLAATPARPRPGTPHRQA